MDAAAIHVVDGDTIAIGSEKFRLRGFDTPETLYARCAHELALGTKAAERLKALIAGGKVEIVPSPRRDRYKRVLATLTIDGVDVGVILIREDLAVPYSGRGKRRDWCE